jgi:hypothetical protein
MSKSQNLNLREFGFSFPLNRGVSFLRIGGKEELAILICHGCVFSLCGCFCQGWREVCLRRALAFSSYGDVDHESLSTKAGF